MRVVAILTAAGSGTRLGHALPKALVRLDGRPLVAYAADALVAGGVEHLVVTAPQDLRTEVSEALTDLAVPVVVVAGGPTRQASVAAGLARLAADLHPATVVLVHDAARPLVPAEVVSRVVAAVQAGHDAVVPALPVVDTVKRVAVGGNGPERVVATVDRAELRTVQTPQGFRLALLRRAHEAAAALAGDERAAASDDAGLIERLGEPVWLVPGHPDAVKITTERDLALAEALLAREGR